MIGHQPLQHFRCNGTQERPNTSSLVSSAIVITRFHVQCYSKTTQCKVSFIGEQCNCRNNKKLLYLALSGRPAVGAKTAAAVVNTSCGSCSNTEGHLHVQQRARARKTVPNKRKERKGLDLALSGRPALGAKTAAAVVNTSCGSCSKTGWGKVSRICTQDTTSCCGVHVTTLGKLQRGWHFIWPCLTWSLCWVLMTIKTSVGCKHQLFACDAGC